MRMDLETFKELFEHVNELMFWSQTVVSFHVVSFVKLH